MSNSIPSNTPRGYFSLSGSGDGDHNGNFRAGNLGDKQSFSARRDTGLKSSNKESWTPGHGLEYMGGVQSKRNDTIPSLRGSPQLNLGSGNGDFSQGGHHINVSKALPKNYGIDPAYTPYPSNARMGQGQTYGRDRERMKEELASSNSLAKTGNGILPGGILCDRQTRGPVYGTPRSETNSLNQRPEMYSSGPNSAPTFTYNSNNNNGSRIGINENENNRVSSLVSEAQKASQVLHSHISESSNQFQDRHTRPTASWNNVGTGGRKEWLATFADQEKENVRNGNKRQQQDAYRASLERQVEQKSRMRAEEERRFNAHPFGPNYEQPNPFWQSSTRTNRPEEIPIQKRNLAQNSSTRISQYEVPCNRVAQARTNLQNSRINPAQELHQNNPSKNASLYNNHTTPAPPIQHQLSGPSGIRLGANNPNTNFRGQGYSSPSVAGRYEDIPQDHGMHPGMENHNFNRLSPTAYQELRHSPVDNNGYNANGYPPGPSRSPGMASQPQIRQPPMYPSQVQQYYANEMPSQIQPQLGQPQPTPHPMHSAPLPSGYPYPNNAYAPAAYPYPQLQVPYPTPYYPFQPPVVGYPQPTPGPMMMMIDPYGNPYPIPQGNASPVSMNSYPPYETQRPGRPEPNRKYNVDEDESIQQKAAEFEKQMRIEQGRNNNINNSSKDREPTNPLPTKPSKSIIGNTERLKYFVEEKLAGNNVDFDELRESIFGRPNNLRTSDTDTDYKPIKDMINRAELAEQIRINKKKKALQAAKDQAEEERLERKLQEFYGLQKQREQNAEAPKEEWSRMHILNKKAVSKHFIAQENNRNLQKMPKNAKQIPRKVEPRPWNPPHAQMDPEESLARKIGNRNISGGQKNGSQPFRGGGDRHNNGRWEQNHGRGDNNQSEEYSYAKYMSQFKPPPSPPLPALVPKTNEETLIGKLSNKTFSRPRLSPSILNARNSSDMRTRIAVEKGLKNKISNSRL